MLFYVFLTFFPFSFATLHLIKHKGRFFFPTMALSNFQTVYNILLWLWQSVVKLKKKNLTGFMSFSVAARPCHQNRGEIAKKKKTFQFLKIISNINVFVFPPGDSGRSDH